MQDAYLLKTPKRNYLFWRGMETWYVNGRERPEINRAYSPHIIVERHFTDILEPGKPYTVQLAYAIEKGDKEKFRQYYRMLCELKQRFWEAFKRYDQSLDSFINERKSLEEKLLRVEVALLDYSTADYFLLEKRNVRDFIFRLQDLEMKKDVLTMKEFKRFVDELFSYVLDIVWGTVDDDECW